MLICINQTFKLSKKIRCQITIACYEKRYHLCPSSLLKWRIQLLNRPARKPTLWILRKALTRISLRMRRRLTRIYTFRLLWMFYFRNHYPIPLSPWEGMCGPGSVCADCTGWSGSIHYAEAILLVFSLDGSYRFPFSRNLFKIQILHLIRL